MSLDTLDALGAQSFRQKLRILTGVAFVAWSVFTLQYALLGRLVSCAVVACAAVAMAVLFACTGPRSSLATLRLQAHVYALINFLGLVAGAEVSGQTASMSLWFLTIIPLVTAYQLGWRAAIGWTATVVATLVLQYVIGLAVLVPADFVAAGWELTAGQIVLTVVILAFGLASRAVNDRHLQALREREAEIARQAEDLRQSRDEAVRAERVKAEFLANMSHEIRTPLNGIIGFTRLLKARPLEERDQVLVDRVSRSGALLLSIVNDILDFSKIESGHLVLTPVAVDVRRLVTGVVEMFSPAAEEKSLALRGSVADDVPPFIEADDTRLQQVLFNLVGNAMKFTERGSVTVQVERAGDDRLHIAVSDTGIGIAADQMDRLFKKFSQVDGSTTRQHGGTGLGLAISRHLVERMDGRMWVVSEPGAGSTFHCELRAPATAPPTPGADWPGAIAAIAPLRILVAEDNLVNQEIIKQYLDLLGQTPTVVDNGLKAVEAVQREVFDVVLLDMQMPEMDGIEATRRIREHTREFDMRPRLVSLSANVMEGHRRKMKEAGIDDILGKPVQLESLARVLRECAERRKSGSLD